MSTGRQSWPTVSAVVPTTGRPSLSDAVASVAAQDYPGQVETVVVVDGRCAETSVARSVQDTATVVGTGGRVGANGARNLGAQRAGGALVAYLDDDDVWDPEKLRRQVSLMRSVAGGAEVVVSSRVRWRRPGSAWCSRAVPDETVGQDTRVEDYLFRRRRPSLGRALLHTSSLVVPRQLAVAVPWEEGLTRHQDWDWLTRLQDEGSARFLMCPEALVTCSLGASGSISATADWAASLSWVERRGAAWTPATRFDFLVAQPLRYALQARSVRGTSTVLATVARTRQVPSWSALTVAAGGLLPRRAFERVALVTGRERHG
jgi:glycosyltransferase involved in cell wall biosynthesis